jgi:hypothetical protein
MMSVSYGSEAPWPFLVCRFVDMVEKKASGVSAMQQSNVGGFWTVI